MRGCSMIFLFFFFLIFFFFFSHIYKETLKYQLNFNKMPTKGDVNVPSVNGVVILDGEGSRIAAKYYNLGFKTVKLENEFEKRMFQAISQSRIVSRGDADMMSIDNLILISKGKADILINVLAPPYENELIALRVLHTIEESLSTVLHNQVSRKVLVENLDLVLLAIDEIIDDGLILEDDPSLVASRVAMNSADDGDVPDVIGQTLSQAFQSSKEQFFK